VDLNEPDFDVLTAYAAQSDFKTALKPCAISIYHVRNIAIDLFGTVAKLDVQLPPSVKHLDYHHECIPATYEGVPVEQSFISTFRRIDLAATYHITVIDIVLEPVLRV